jgi:hypothetical protein
MTTAPAPGPRYGYVTDARASLVLRLVAVAAVIAILVVGILILADNKITVDRVATGFISTGVLGAILIII